MLQSCLLFLLYLLFIIGRHYFPTGICICQKKNILLSKIGSCAIIVDYYGDCFTCEWIKAHGAPGESVENFALKTLHQNLVHTLYLGVSFHKLGTIIPNCNSYQSVNGMTGTTHRRGKQKCEQRPTDDSRPP